MSEITDEQYFLRVEQHFGRRRGGPLMLSPSDWRLLEGWRAQGIPLRVVLRGINQAFDRFAASGPRPDRINSLRYCAQEVQAAWEDHCGAYRRSDTGTADSTGLPAASAHLAAVATACRRAASALGDAAAACLVDAADELDGLERHAREGSLDAREIDARSVALEQRLYDELRQRLSDAARLDEVSLPRFSPYEAS
jgi:hypothetical protein